MPTQAVRGGARAESGDHTKSVRGERRKDRGSNATVGIATMSRDIDWVGSSGVCCCSRQKAQWPLPLNKCPESVEDCSEVGLIHLAPCAEQTSIQVTGARAVATHAERVGINADKLKTQMDNQAKQTHRRERSVTNDRIMGR